MNIMGHRYEKSENFLKQASKIIPLGSQTFSKSRIALPFGVSPYFVESAEGCKLTDIDGNIYTDFVSALLSVSLGYCDKDVENAVTQQLRKGVTFSLPHRLEAECAERLVELIPCAEQVRFGKNGTDATSAAVRLARAYTGRESIATCGYHGWQDWYIGSTSRNLGVPNCVKALTHTFQFNDIKSLEQLFAEHQNTIAAVIMEPMCFDFPKDDFLHKVKALCEKEGAVLIFDEMITGFRFDLGGAQQLFSVIPDLATFGKGMANGFPLSAVVGRQDIMRLMSDIFYSGTFSGETLSLAAGIATIDKLESCQVIPHIITLGEQLIKRIQSIIHEIDCTDIISVSGHPSWSHINISDYKNYDALTIKTYIMQRLFEKNYFWLGTHNLNYSHQASDVDNLIDAYKEVLFDVKYHCENDTLTNQIQGEILKPLFKVRSS